MKSSPSPFSRFTGWIFPALLSCSIGLHLGVFWWQEEGLWILPGGPEPPLPTVELLMVEETPEPKAPVEELLSERPVEKTEVAEVPKPDTPKPSPPPEPARENASKSPTLPPPAPTAWTSSRTRTALKSTAPSAAAKARVPSVEARPDTRHTPAPRYPEAARRAGQQGRVLVRVEVDSAGWVRTVALARSSGVESLDRAALDAVRRWRFHPRLVEGVPTSATVEVPVFFTLTR